MEGEKKTFHPDIYLGNLKAKKRKSGEQFLAGSICLEQVYESIPEDMIQEAANGKHYVRVIIQENFEPDKFGNTHSIKIDTFKPMFKGPTEDNNKKQ